jgi:hypothetical protein
MEIINHIVLIDVDSEFKTLSNKQVTNMKSKSDSFPNKL